MDLLTLSDWRVQDVEELYRLIEYFEEWGREFDFILYAGDDLGRFVDEGTNHFDQVAEMADTQVGFVRGNDDLPPGLGAEIETDRVHDLHRNPQLKGNYHFLGQEGAVGETAIGLITYTEAKAKSHLEELYSEHENREIVLVSHTPPHGILDIGRRYGENNIGSHAVREFAEDVEPDLLVCGHVHQFGGQTEECSFGHVINVASHDNEAADARFATVGLTRLLTKIEHSTIEELLGDPLTRLAQVGKSRAQSLRAEGFESIDDLTWDRRSELLELDHMWETVADQILRHAEAYREDRPIIADPTEIADIRDREPVVVDIETNLACDRVWLVGIYDYQDDSFNQFFELDDETEVCRAFVDYVDGREDTPIVYYAGQGFDERVLTDRIESTGLSLSESSLEWIDICQIARHAIFLPDEGHNLSTIAKGLGYEFTHPEVSGFEVGGAYSAYRTSGKEADWEQYCEYNRDDVLAVKHVLDTVSEEREIGQT